MGCSDFRLVLLFGVDCEICGCAHVSVCVCVSVCQEKDTIRDYINS